MNLSQLFQYIDNEDLSNKVENAGYKAGVKNAKMHLKKYGAANKCTVRVPAEFRQYDNLFRKAAFRGYSQVYYEDLQEQETKKGGKHV